MSQNILSSRRSRAAGAIAVKRIVDLALAAAMLILLAPVMLIIALLVRVLLGAPVLFRQMRPGLNGTPFRLYKFRTMNDRRGPDGELLPDGLRLTRLGRILRKTSLDELPSLFNVVKGEMSLVGPRPLLMSYLDKYTPEQARRHDVRPGITGWAQVNGRQTIKFSKRIAHDVWYVDNWSLRLDLKILLLTLWQVFGGSGVISGQDVADVDDLGFHASRENAGTGESP